MMDQVKIGKFIAKCRKDIGLTQMELAEKLNITDRAVSKWENGKSMPDSSIMLELCQILKITVNDLLSGEVVSMDNYNKELENNLLEAIKEKENADKRLLLLEWVVGIFSLIILLVPTIVVLLTPMEEWRGLLIIFAGLLVALVGFLFAIKIEQVAGYYECGKCGNKYVPTYSAVTLAMHIGRTRYLKCPLCGKWSWSKKKISKDEEK